MKTKIINTFARLTIATALLAVGVGISAAGETSTAKGGASQVIQLPVSNNATPSVTIWTGK